MASYTRKISLPGKSADEIYGRISKAVDGFLAKDSGKFGKFNLQRDEKSKTLQLESSQATARLRCEDGGIHLDGKLSFLASAFRGKIDGWIDQWIEKSFKS
jgi:hypothetical protein